MNPQFEAFTPEQVKALNTPPPAFEVEWKQVQGREVPYLDGEYALRTAQEIFGPGNFSYQILGTVEVIPTGQLNKNETEIFLVSAQVQVQIRTRLGDWLSFADVGDCESQGTGAPAMSMARKGAVTDGVKRCLRSWPAFGSVLYTREGRQEYSDAKKAGNKPQPTQTAKPAAVAPKPQPAPKSAPAPVQKPAAIDPKDLFEELWNELDKAQSISQLDIVQAKAKASGLPKEALASLRAQYQDCRAILDTVGRR